MLENNECITENKQHPFKTNTIIDKITCKKLLLVLINGAILSCKGYNNVSYAMSTLYYYHVVTRHFTQRSTWEHNCRILQYDTIQYTRKSISILTVI